MNVAYQFKKYFPIISTTLFVGLIILFVARTYLTKPQFISSAIHEDISVIALVLEKIDHDCSILSFEHSRNFVDFLNITAFVGSRVGSINLAYPKNWNGSYLRNNPTVQEKFYEVVKAKDGLFVIPGVGVKLPNGKTIGKEIKIDENVNVSPMLNDGGFLTFENQKLGAQLKFKIGDWNKPVKIQNKKMENISNLLKEFNEAMPFTENEKKDLNI